MSEGKHMGIWHNWAVYRHAQVIYGVAIERKKGVNEGVNSGKSDNMGVLHLLDFSDGTSVTGMCRQGEVPFWVMNMLMPLSTCMGSRPGLRVIKVTRPEFSARVF